MNKMLIILSILACCIVGGCLDDDKKKQPEEPVVEVVEELEEVVEVVEPTRLPNVQNDSTVLEDDIMFSGRERTTYRISLYDLTGLTIIDFSNREKIIILGADLSYLNGTPVTDLLTLSSGKEVKLLGLLPDIWIWEAVFKNSYTTLTFLSTPLGGGTEGDDTLYGTPYNDLLWGGRGNDIIWGGAGSDDITGGEGEKWGDPDGDDTIYGEGGEDWIDYSRGMDIIDGGDDEDAFNTDKLKGGVYAVIDFSVPPAYAILFNSDGTAYDGGNFTTLINIEITSTGEGNDIIVGSDRDELFLDNGGTANNINGGGGNDILSYTYDVSGIGVKINLGTGFIGGAAAGDTITNIEGLSGTKHADLLGGDNGDNQLFGWQGNDSIAGAGGADLLAGEAGIDILTGGAGLDTFWGSVNHLSGDTITDLSYGEQIVIYDADLSALHGADATEVLNLGGINPVTLTGVSGRWTAIYTPSGVFGAWMIGFGETPYGVGGGATFPLPDSYKLSNFTTLTYVE